MLQSFAEGFILGLGAAVPIGPVNIVIMTKALKNYTNGVSIGFGAMSADITYVTLVLFGFFVFIKNNIVQNIIGVFGAFFLFYIAYIIFKNRNEGLKINIKGSKNEQTKIIQNYLKGYALTLLNPYTIGFWISVSAYITTKNISFGWTLFGVFTGILLWITIMPYIVHRTKHLFSDTMIKNISIILSLVLFFFAITLTINILSKI